MSYNGSGTFLINSAGQPVVANTVISATVFNALTADLATGLSTAITKDGQTTVTANIPFGNNKITTLGAGTAATDAANLGQVQSTAAKLITVTGTDTITGSMSPQLTAYAAGQLLYFIANAANTGAVTINVDGLGAKAITRDGSTALAAGDINSGEVVVIVYDGTRFQMINAANSFGNTTINGTLTVTGNTGLQANVSITSALSVGGTFNVTGAATLGSTLSVTGKSDLPTVSTASINAAVALITTGTVTNLTATGASIASANIGTAVITTGTVTNLTSTSASIASANAAVALVTTGTVTNLTSTSASIASANLGTAVISGLTVTGASIASVNVGAAVLSGNLTLNGGTASGVVYLNASKVATSGSALVFDGTNLGLGVTPSAWGSAYNALQMGNGLSLFSTKTGTPSFYLSSNAYFDTGYKYQSNGFASEYYQFQGTHGWRTAASGTAGNAITFSQAMTLDASGNFLVGTTTQRGRITVVNSGYSVLALGTSSSSSARGGAINFESESPSTRGQILYDTASDFMSFSTATAERARITAGGDFGIGTTSPGDKFQVAGNIATNTVGDRYRGNTTALSMAANDSTTVNAGFGGLLIISLGSGDSAHFYCPYGAATSLIRSDSANGTSFSATDTGTAVRVYKSNNTSTVTIKNSSGATVSAYVGIYAGY